MNKLLVVLSLLCTLSCTTEKDRLKEENKKLKEEVKQLYEYIDVQQEALQLRESEISYWGHKYDSVVYKVKK